MNPYFDISDPRSVVWTIQRMLLALSRVDPEVPRVNPDGYYGDETRYAVSAFQRSRGLPETGDVDLDTFNRLLDDYSKTVDRKGKSEGIFPFERRLSGDRVSPGDVFDLVLILQVMLNTIGMAFDDISVSDINGEYNEETRRNVAAFQRLNGLEETGYLDQVTWNRLAQLYNAMIDSD